MKSALIVGSRGQDGTILRELLAGKGYAVTGLSRQALELADGSLAAPVDVTDPLAVQALVGELRPCEAYYLAAFHHSSQQDPGVDMQAVWDSSMAVNATGPVTFLEAIRMRSPETRFFLAGSCLAYGRPDNSPQDEDTCFRPSCAYGISKAAGAHAVRLYRETYGLFAVTGILYNHESHLRPEHFLSRKIVSAVLRIKNGLQNELVLGDLSARADWGYAPDFVESFWRTLQAVSPDDYVVATGTLHRVLDWVERAFSLAGLDWRDHVREDPRLAIRRREPLVGNSTRIRSRLGWTPATQFERMVELIFEHEGRLSEQ